PARRRGAPGARAAAGLPRPRPPVRSYPPGPALTSNFDAERAAAAGLESALRKVVSGEVRFDPYTRHLFSRDASMYAIEPIGVVFPPHAPQPAAPAAPPPHFPPPLPPRP